MWQAIKSVYRTAARFAATLPLIVAFAIGFEALQHVVEWSIGLYVNRDAAQLLQWHPARMAADIAKIAVVTLLLYYVARFVLRGESRPAAARRESATERTFAPVLGFSVALGIVSLAAEYALAHSGLPRGAIAAVLAIVLLGGALLNIALSYWFAGAAVAVPRASARASLAASRGSLWWAVGLTLAVILPAMALHYALGGLAIGKASAVAVAMLAIDSVVVGFLSILIGASNVVIAKRMAQRHGLPL